MLVWLSLIIFFCLPYALWFFQLFSSRAILAISEINWTEVIEALQNSIFQGFIAALVSLALGTVLFLAIHSLKINQTKLAILTIFPFLMPALYILSVYFSITQSVVFGNASVGFVHGYVLSGHVAHNLWNSYRRYWIKFESVSLIFGAGRAQHWFNILKLQKSEIFSSIILAILLGATSFAIPLALGGANGGNLEMLIFQKLKFGENVADLNVIVFIQIILIVVFELLREFVKSHDFIRLSDFGNHSVQVRKELQFSYMWIVLILYVGILFVPLIHGFIHGISAVLRINDVMGILGTATLHSLRLYGLAFVLMAAILALLTYCVSLHPKLWIGIFLAPLSASIVAYVLWNISIVTDQMKLLYAYCFIFIPFLFRFGIQARIRLLDHQVLASRLLGSSNYKTWRDIVYPQFKHEIYVLASIGAFWCLLDFAVIKLFISEANYSLALIAQSWLASYRYYESQGLIFLLTIFGISVIFGVHYALNRDI